MAKHKSIAVIVAAAALYVIYRGFRQYEEQQVQIGMNNARARLREARNLSGNTSELGERIDRVINFN